MKKFITLLLALGMIFAFTGCSAKEKTYDTKELILPIVVDSETLVGVFKDGEKTWEETYYQSGELKLTINHDEVIEVKDLSKVNTDDRVYTLDVKFVNNNLTHSLTLDGEKADAIEFKHLAQVANPWQDIESLDAIKEALGFDLSVPEEINGSSISLIQISEDMAQVFYGEDILVRKAEGTEDISGDYNEYENVQELEVGSLIVTSKDDKLFIWNDGKYSYSLSLPKAIENIQEIIELIK